MLWCCCQKLWGLCRLVGGFAWWVVFFFFFFLLFLTHGGKVLLVIGGDFQTSLCYVPPKHALWSHQLRAPWLCLPRLLFQGGRVGRESDIVLPQAVTASVVTQGLRESQAILTASAQDSANAFLPGGSLCRWPASYTQAVCGERMLGDLDLFFNTLRVRHVGLK